MERRDGAVVGRLLAFALMALIWGFTWLPMKLASQVVPPIFLATVRFLIASGFFLAFALVRGLPLRPDRPWRLLFASLLITTGCYAFVFWGVARSPTGISAIVNLALLPIFVILIGALYGQERITGRRVAAIVFGVVGLVLLFSSRRGGAEDAATAAVGLSSVAVGTLCYAWGAVVSRPLMAAMPPVSLAFWETLLGGLALIPVTLLVEGYDPARFAALLEWRGLLGLGVLIFGGSLGAFSIYLWLVRDWGAFRAGLYAFVSPIVAVIVGVVFAHEAFGWPEAVGMAVMLAATALALTERRPAER